METSRLKPFFQYAPVCQQCTLTVGIAENSSTHFCAASTVWEARGALLIAKEKAEGDSATAVCESGRRGSPNFPFYRLTGQGDPVSIDAQLRGELARIARRTCCRC